MHQSFMAMKIVLLALLLLAINGCGSSEGNDGAQQSGAANVQQPAREQGLPKIVYTTNYPLTYFSQRIGGDEVEVHCPVPPDEDPVFWRPDSEVLAAYRESSLIVINGAEYEKWIRHVSLPPTRVVNTAAPLRDQFITTETVTHSHGPGGEHTHEGIDGHTWLDPNNAIVQAEVILRAFSDSWPELRSTFEANYADLRADLEFIENRLAVAAQVMQERQILCSHPSYNYLAARYEWTVENFALDPDEPLSDAKLAEISEVVDRQRKTLLLWESKPLEETIERLESDFGIISVVFSPAEMLRSDDSVTVLSSRGMNPRISEEEREATYTTLMNQNLQNLHAALRR